MKIALLAALVASCCSTAAFAAGVLQPSSMWQVDYGESACSALRAYGPGPNALVVGLVPAPTFGATQISIVRRGSGALPLEHGATLEGPGGAVTTTVIDYPAAKGRKIVSRIVLTPAQYKMLATDGTLHIRFDGFEQKILLTNVAGVERELDKCVADLDELWQSPLQQKRIKTGAEPMMPLGRYFSSTDYPSQAQREHTSGEVGVRMMIDETGKMQNCTTLHTSGSAILDAMTCVVLNERAKFHPAVDVDGKPVKSVLDQRVHWQL